MAGEFKHRSVGNVLELGTEWAKTDLHEVDGQQAGDTLMYDGTRWRRFPLPPTVRTYGGAGDGTTDDSGAWNDLITGVAGTVTSVLVYPGTYKLSSNVTFPANLGVVMLPGAIFSVDSGKTLTFNGSFQAGNGQCLSGSGTVAFGAHATPYYNPRWWGAAFDGVTADDDALDKAYTACAVGDRILIPAGSTVLTKQRHIWTKAIVLEMHGASVYHNPTDTAQLCPFTFSGTFSDTDLIPGTTRYNKRPITGSIAVGATSFVATNAADVTDLVAKDWLFVHVQDAALNDTVTCDYVQVASVVGTTVNLLTAFRTAFDSTHEAVLFHRFTNFVEGVTILGGYIYTTQAATFFGMDIRRCKDTKIIGLKLSIRQGNPFVGQYNKGLMLDDCDAYGATTQGSEFASCVDFHVHNCNFITEDYTPGNTVPALSVDMGTAFFSIVGCSVQSGMRGIVAQYGCHDGSIVGNSVVSGAASSIGIQLLATQRITVVGNTLVNAGSGGTSTAVAVDYCLQGQTGYSYNGVTAWLATIPSTGNIIGPNTSIGYTREIDNVLTTNTYIGTTSAGLSSMKLSQIGTNGQVVTLQQATIQTAVLVAAFTDSALQLPANAIIVAVSTRVTTAIPTAATFTVTGAATGTAFQTAAVSTALGSTDKGNANCPYNNGAAQAVRITPNLVPAAATGFVRITIHYLDITPATS